MEYGAPGPCGVPFRSRLLPPLPERSTTEGPGTHSRVRRPPKTRSLACGDPTPPHPGMDRTGGRYHAPASPPPGTGSTGDRTKADGEKKKTRWKENSEKKATSNETRTKTLPKPRCTRRKKAGTFLPPDALSSPGGPFSGPAP